MSVGEWRKRMAQANGASELNEGASKWTFYVEIGG